MAHKIGRSIKKFVRNPKRIGKAIITGGASETTRAATKTAKGAVGQIVPKIPPPAAIPGIPTVADPLVAAAKEKLRLSEKRRRGRRAAILTPQDEGAQLGQIRRASATGA